MINLIKKAKIISIFILLILLTSCGFKAFNQNQSEQIYIQKIKIVGDQRIAYLLKNNIRLASSNKSEKRYDVAIKIEKQKIDKIKDDTGKVKRFTLSLNLDLRLIDLNTNNKKQKTFTRNRDYSVGSIHSDTIDNENEAMKNIIKNISDDIIIFINMPTRN
tara:strand:+ start:128 stop:610 length:483 start_codon:yes stop_codon:yes gene_type:complete